MLRFNSFKANSQIYQIYFEPLYCTCTACVCTSVTAYLLSVNTLCQSVCLWSVLPLLSVCFLCLSLHLPCRLRSTASTRGSGYSWTDTSSLTFITKWNPCPPSTQYGYKETYRSPSSVNLPAFQGLDHRYCGSQPSSVISHHAPPRQQRRNERKVVSAPSSPVLSIPSHLFVFRCSNSLRVNVLAPCSGFFFLFVAPVSSDQGPCVLIAHPLFGFNVGSSWDAETEAGVDHLQGEGTSDFSGNHLLRKDKYLAPCS